VKGAKANLLVQQYKLFKMKYDEEIEAIYSRFQTLCNSSTLVLRCSMRSSNTRRTNTNDEFNV